MTGMATTSSGHVDPSFDAYSSSHHVIDDSLNPEDEESVARGVNHSHSDSHSSSDDFPMLLQENATCCSFCLASWRIWIRQLIMFVYIVLFVTVSVVLVLGTQSYNINQFTSANFLAGIAMAFTVPMSLWGISQHLINYTKPSLQKYIIRILWMVPIYSVLSFCGLHFTKNSVILDAIKDCYEAFVVYSFTCYLVRYLQQQHSLDFSAKSAKHVFPFCWVSSWQGHESIVNCTIGVLQYTLVKPIVTVVTVITYILHVYREGSWDFGYAWIYTMVVNNISQIWALYCLVLFYRTFKSELKGSRPVAKFMCIKLVIFATWWQSLAISILVHFINFRKIQWIADRSESDVELSHAIQDFAVCFEMFIAAIAHHYAFTHREFKDVTQRRVKFVTAFQNMFDVRDLGNDVISHGYIVRQKVKDRIRGNGRTRLDNESNENLSSSSNTVHRGKPTVVGPQRLLVGDSVDFSDRDTVLFCEVATFESHPAATSRTFQSRASGQAKEGGTDGIDMDDESGDWQPEHFGSLSVSIDAQERAAGDDPGIANPSPVIKKLDSDHVQFSMCAKGDARQ